MKCQPWLSVRCSLSLALCLAALDRKEEARKALEESWVLYPLVQEDSERTVIQWLEGKVASWLGEIGEAHNLLDSARWTLLAQQRLVEAGLASLDLAALYTGAHRPGEVKRLMGDLRRQAWPA